MKSTPIVADWPLLFIKIDKVDQISLSSIERIDERIISVMEFEIVDGRKYIAIDDVFGGQVDILFSGDVSFLALEGYEKILNI